MADFIEVMESVWSVEHNHKKDKILHFNPKEKSYTFYGIYPYTKLPSWQKIRSVITRTNSLKVASRILAEDIKLYQEVLYYYYKHYWQPMGLDNVISTHKAAEIMVFMINIGIGRKKQVIKAIQRLVGAKVDGIMGKETLSKLNSFNEVSFDHLFDKYEITWYDRLVRKHPRLSWAISGWHNRAKRV